VKFSSMTGLIDLKFIMLCASPLLEDISGKSCEVSGGSECACEPACPLSLFPMPGGCRASGRPGTPRPLPIGLGEPPRLTLFVRYILDMSTGLYGMETKHCCFAANILRSELFSARPVLSTSLNLCDKI
jgi:hypothetical protein